MSRSDEKLICFKPKNALLTPPYWERTTGHRVDMDEVALSLAKSPPLLLNPSPVVAAPSPAIRATKKTRNEQFLENIAAFAQFVHDVAAPAPPRAGARSSPPKKPKLVPPFDLQDVPGAMDNMGMSISAALLRKWFRLALTYPTSKSGKTSGIDQNGNPYSAANIDTTTLKLDWILGFPRAREKFEKLQTHEYLTTPESITQIKRIINKFPRGTRSVMPHREVGNDRRKLHDMFQFQIITVDTTWTEKAKQYLDSDARGGVPDDLAGALGGFAFYARIGAAEIEHFHGGRRVATITHAFFYMKNPYSFFDDGNDGSSQYLGHWNKKGVLLAPASFIASKIGMGDLEAHIKTRSNSTPAGIEGWAEFPVLVGEDVNIRDAVYYSVRNKVFRAWQILHKQGGDMLLFSDEKPVRLSPPIVEL